MQIYRGIIEAIGHTPLIRLQHASDTTGCTILGKAEFMNPGQSVKDRAALFIIEDAVKNARLRPGGVIVEGTAGNTGIGLALVGNALGFRSVIVIPDTQSQEKKDMLRRAHWGVENRLHWVLDVVFHDDLARLRTLNGPQNMAGSNTW